MKTTKVDSMPAVLGFGAAAKASALKLANQRGRPVLCRPRRGAVKEIQPGGRWSMVEWEGDKLVDDIGTPIDTTGKSLLFHYAAIALVKEYAFAK